MLPGVSSNLFTKDKEKEATQKLQRYLNALDSMNKKELDCMVPLDDARITRVARGSGVHPAEIKGLMAQYEQMKNMVKQVGSISQMGNMDMQKMKRNP